MIGFFFPFLTFRKEITCCQASWRGLFLWGTSKFMFPWLLPGIVLRAKCCPEKSLIFAWKNRLFHQNYIFFLYMLLRQSFTKLSFTWYTLSSNSSPELWDYRHASLYWDYRHASLHYTEITAMHHFAGITGMHDYAGLQTCWGCSPTLLCCDYGQTPSCWDYICRPLC